MRKPKIGVLGFSDGEPEVHTTLKDIVQAQMDAVVSALQRSGQVARLPVPHETFLEKFDANHCHAVYGDHVESLKSVSRMLQIDAEVLGA